MPVRQELREQRLRGRVGIQRQPGLGGQFVGSPGEPLDDIAFGSNAQPSGRGTSQDAGVFFDQQTDGDVRSRVENLFDQSLGDPSIMTGSGGMSLQYVFLDDVQLEAIFRAVRKVRQVLGEPEARAAGMKA